MIRLSLVSLRLLLIAAVTLPLVFSQHSTRAYVVQTVEVSPLGFNPAVCRMNREYIRFHNVGNTVIRVGRPSALAGQPPFDVHELQPGEFTPDIIIPFGGTSEFIDVDNPAHSVTVITPVFVMYWDPICTPDPDFQPPQPPCRTNPYCLRLALLSAD